MDGDMQALSRYRRQMALPQLGLAGQKRLLSSRVLIVGLGGLGAPVLQYLAAAGVGTIGLCDGDKVDESNLHRQVIYGVDDVGLWKVEAAANWLKGHNPALSVKPFQDFIDESNVGSLLADFDVVVDCTDNLAARYVLNDACLALGLPLVYGALHRFEGQVSVFCLPGGPCFRCYLPESGSQPQTCAEAGVLGVLPGVVGTLQATECLKILLGLGESLNGEILFFDALACNFARLSLEREPGCICAEHAEATALATSASDSSSRSVSGSAAGSASPFASGSVSPSASGSASPSADATSIDADSLSALLTSGRSVRLIDVRSVQEFKAMRFAAGEHHPLESILELEEAPPSFISCETLVLYCRSGQRSLDAQLKLAGLGVPTLNLSGGILAWHRRFQDRHLATDTGDLLSGDS